LSALLFAIPALARADSAVSNTWLERLAHSMGELNYRGVLTYTRGEHQESLRVTHGVFGGEEYERLEHLDGANREVFRHGQQLTCIQLGRRLDLLLHQHLLKTGLVGLDPYYDVKVTEDGRVAGRRTANLLVQPRDEFRFGYRLALDYDTGLLLRSESLDSGGHVLERLQFVEIDIGLPLKKESFGGTTSAAAKSFDPVSIDRVIEEEQMAWKPHWLPPGFTLALAPHRPSEEVLTYSDGLAVFSIFVESNAATLPSGEGSAIQGATVAYTRPVRVGKEPHLVVVVGEVPRATAKRVADSVGWNGDSPIETSSRK
jgi:sigma-E factor negative regulatory protein RseB